MKRIQLIILSAFLLLVMNGCGNGVADVSYESTSEQVPASAKQENPGTAQDPGSSEINDGFAITESDQIPGWKKLEAKVPLSELTEFGSQPLEDSEEFEFSFHFPGDWAMSHTVFYDENNQKIAEIPPVVLLKPGQETEFLTYNPSEVSDEELLTKADFPVSSYMGSRAVTRVATERDNWYPHIYRITDGTYGFSVVLYSGTLDDKSQALFDRIASTVRF